MSGTKKKKVDVYLNEEEFEQLSQMCEKFGFNTYNACIRAILFGYDDNPKILDSLLDLPFTHTVLKHLDTILENNPTLYAEAFEVYEKNHPHARGLSAIYQAFVNK